jgi:hypothetical protein
MKAFLNQQLREKGWPNICINARLRYGRKNDQEMISEWQNMAKNFEKIA